VPLRCLLVDDSPQFLGVASNLLERGGLTVVGVASNSTEALERARELEPDVTIVDVQLGGESGSTWPGSSPPQGPGASS
jgi:CheY-like chemotaxis protein